MIFKVVVAVGAAGALLVGGLALRSFNDGPALGNHLSVMNPSSLRNKKLPPGTKVLNTIGGFSNESSEEVTVRSVVPLVVKGGSREEIVRRIELSPRSTGIVAGGTYGFYPPAERVRGKCRVQVMRPVAGYRLRPGEAVRIAVLHQVPSGAGRWKISRFRVTYEVDGKAFYSDQPWTLWGRISRDAKPYVVDRYDKRCLHLAKRVFWPSHR